MGGGNNKKAGLPESETLRCARLLCFFKAVKEICNNRLPRMQCMAYSSYLDPHVQALREFRADAS
jgi:hypothetical protein